MSAPTDTTKNENSLSLFALCSSVQRELYEYFLLTLDAAFQKGIDHLVNNLNMWRRIKGLDTRQRVGRYAGMFMRIRDGKQPDQPIDGTLNGLNALVQMVPLYEGQLKVNEVDNDPKSERYGLPVMYQFNGGTVGNRDEKQNAAFAIHPDRIIIAAEGADNGDIYGIPALEAAYNSLMDLRKIIGAGGEGFYKNAAQSIVFNLEDGASAKENATLLGKFTDNADDFMRNRMRRSLWTPGMKAQTLDSNLANPKDHFMDALYDASAASKILATVLIGQQTGRLASSEDSKSFLSGINSRRENFVTEMVSSVIDWCIVYGVLPSAEYEVEWGNLLELSDNEKLDKSVKMAETNSKQFQSGGAVPFTGDEIRDAAGYDPSDEEDIIPEPKPDEEVVK